VHGRLLLKPPLLPAFVPSVFNPLHRSCLIYAQDEETLRTLASNIAAQPKAAAIAAILAIESREDASTILVNVKPGVARAALLAMSPELAGLTLEELNHSEISGVMSAFTPKEIAAMLKQMTLEEVRGKSCPRVLVGLWLGSRIAPDLHSHSDHQPA